jgi:hypothetical protein
MQRKNQKKAEENEQQEVDSLNVEMLSEISDAEKVRAVQWCSVFSSHPI